LEAEEEEQKEEEEEEGEIGMPGAWRVRMCSEGGGKRKLVADTGYT